MEKVGPAAAVPEEEPEQESVAASTLCVAVPACSFPTESPKHKLLVDTGAAPGAGGGLAPCGFDFGAREVPGPRVSMTTVTGEPLELGKKKVSSLQHEKVSVSFAYRESKDVSFPVISMSEASSKGTWLVIGPNTQCLVPKDQGWKLEEALKQSKKVPLLKEKGVYWLEAQQGTLNASPESMIAAPAAREIRAEDADDSGPAGPGGCGTFGRRSPRRGPRARR